MASDRKDIHNSDIPVLCRTCEARHKGMCGVLQPEELRALARRTTKAKRDAGDELIGDGEPIRSYANVMAGVVKLSKVLDDGRQQIVGLQFAPDLLGRLFGETSNVAAEAATDVELCVVPRQVLEQMIAETPQLEHRVMQQNLRELDEARDWMVTLGRKTAEEKVASLLLLIATHADPGIDAASARLALPLTRAEMADYLGLTVETVSRVMTRLRVKGVIRVEGTRGIEVLSVDGLRGLAG